MHLLTLGLNHQTAPLALRERVAFVPEEVGSTITRLRERLSDRSRGRVTEAAIVSTCNRTELYCAVEQPQAAGPALADFVAQHKRLDTDEFRRSAYLLPQADAVRHAFRVASGLDSMVLGEPQILGQMKQAERLSREAGGLGLLLNHLFQRTFAVAKEVRSSTEIGAHSVSMAAAAVRVAESIFGELADSDVLLVGAGEMIELTATHFAAQHPRSIVIANRTLDRGEKLAQRFNADTIRLAELPDALERFDIVVSCTASTLPIIGLGMVERATRARRRRPMFMVDLAVPRDIEQEVARLDDVFLYTVDDLGKLVQTGAENRRAAVAQAEAIIETRVDSFMQWLSTRKVVPMIRQLHARGEALKAAELERARRMLARGDDPAAVMEALAQGLTSKFLHGPTTLLQRGHEERETIVRFIDHLLPDNGNSQTDGQSSGPSGRK